MHLIKLLSLLLIATSVYVHATDVTKEEIAYYANKLNEAEQHYSQKIIFCRRFRNRHSNWFDFWLQSQTIDARRFILQELNHRAESRCNGSEQKTYAVALLQHAVVTGNEQEKDNWLHFYARDEYDSSPRPKHIPEYEYNFQLERLTLLPAFYFPFSISDAATIIPDAEYEILVMLDQAYSTTPYIKGLR
ncbi:MAG: hypothetical protein LBU96_02560 [Yokenella regensburgei]|jgi:hypothetical protein|uniref:hypothetical protein n=1 Tax=Yokenella regensburgei TaxID=158877 RepID=UPI002848700B|nr:hypothetical protein [Yokenella regensburgei]